MSVMRVFSGNANPALARKVAEHLGRDLDPIIVSRFNDGEIRVEIQINVRDADVFIIQPLNKRNDASNDDERSYNGSINDHLMELLVVVDACRRASAGKITAVIPYYAYSRQERKVKPRVPITAALVADLLQAVKVHRVLTFDLHAGAIQGFFSNPVDNLAAAPVLRDYVLSLKKIECSKHKECSLQNITIVSPDAGGATRAEDFRKLLLTSGVDSGLTIMSKMRGGAGVVDRITLMGDVKDRDCILIDDIIDTAGTLVKAAEVLHEHGARVIYALATHGLFTKDALEKIENSVIKRVIVTDTIPQDERRKYGKIVQVSISHLLAQAIDRTHNGQSISQLFM